MLLDRVAEIIFRYNMMPPHSRVGAAVSGGADSVCLLTVLQALSRRHGWQVHVVHVNHRWRGEESEQDAAFVRQLADSAGLPFHLRIAPAAADEAKENGEQAARNLRWDLFRELLAAGIVDRIATGHTRDDQAETVLFRVLRGAGATGWAGIRRVTSEGIVRPLLAESGATLRAFLVEQGVPWREDQSNQDDRFARNRIRHELLPVLQRDWNPQLPALLAQAAELAAEDEDYWQATLPRWTEPLLHARPGAVLAKPSALLALPLAVSRRVVREAIRRVKGNLHQIDYLHVDNILELCRASEGHGRLQVPGVDVCRSFDWLRLALPETGQLAARFAEQPVVIGSTYRLPFDQGSISFEEGEFPLSPDLPNADCVYTGRKNELDRSCLPDRLILRSWRPGDSYEPAGMNGQRKLKQLFQDFRVPLWERRAWPVLEADGRIAWTRQFGAANWCQAATGQKRKVRVKEQLDGGRDESNRPILTSV